ncbi:MAG TPA: hypothetical protein VGL06_25995 [Pseudonocardiaceae bacterium]
MTERLDTDERAELTRLRDEITILRAATGSRARGANRWRALGAAVLIGLGCLLAPVSLVAVWAHDEVADTNQFVANVAPLIRTPSVQAALTERVTDTVFTYVDVQRSADQAIDALSGHGLPAGVADRLHGLTDSLAAGVHGFVQTQVRNLVASARFAAVWDQVTGIVHQQLVNVLAGNGSAVVISHGKVLLDLAPFIVAVKQRLVASGFTAANVVPVVHPTITLTDASTLVRARSAYHLLDVIATWAGWVTLSLLAGGIALARDRRRALRNGGIGLAASMVLLAAALLVAGAMVVNTVPDSASVPVSDSFDIVVRYLRANLRSVFVLGLVVAVGAAITGPSPWAVRTRQRSVAVIAGLRRWVWPAGHGGRTGAWFLAHRTALDLAALIVAVLVFVFLDQPSGVTVLVIAATLGACLGVIQFLARPG